MKTRQKITETTGFDNGVEFETEAQVREYFVRETLQSCIDPTSDVRGDIPDQATLDEYANAVIDNRWHCTF
jgi:hypothetical protein